MFYMYVHLPSMYLCIESSNSLLYPIWCHSLSHSDRKLRFLHVWDDILEMYSNLRSGAVSSQSWCGVPLRPYSVILRSHGHMGGKLLPLGPQLPHHIGQGKWSHFQGCEPLGVSIPQQSTHHMLLLLMGLNGWWDGTSPVLKCADHCHLVSVTVVGSEVKVFIRVGRLFKHSGGNGYITKVFKVYIQERKLPFWLLLQCELVSMEIRCLCNSWQQLAGNAIQVSSTYLHQNLKGTSVVARTLSSTSSIAKLATVTETGDPIAMPKICW